VRPAEISGLRTIVELALVVAAILCTSCATPAQRIFSGGRYESGGLRADSTVQEVPIRGQTPHAVWESMRREMALALGTDDHILARSSALFGYKADCVQADDPPVSVRVAVEIRVVLPVLQEELDVDRRPRSSWRDVRRHLELHELAHVQIYFKEARVLLRELRRMARDTRCAGIPEAADAIKAAVDERFADEHEYIDGRSMRPLGHWKSRFLQTARRPP